MELDERCWLEAGYSQGKVLIYRAQPYRPQVRSYRPTPRAPSPAHRREPAGPARATPYPLFTVPVLVPVLPWCQDQYSTVPRVCHRCLRPEFIQEPAHTTEGTQAQPTDTPSGWSHAYIAAPFAMRAFSRADGASRPGAVVSCDCSPSVYCTFSHPIHSSLGSPTGQLTVVISQSRRPSSAPTFAVPARFGHETVRQSLPLALTAWASAR